MEDWRYESLNRRLDRLQEEMREVKGRTYKVESWQGLFPLNVLTAVCWLFSIGMLIFVLAEALAGS